MRHVASLCLATAVVVSGCNDDDDVHEWSADIQGLGEWADISGEAEVRWEEGEEEFTATVDIENDAPGAVRPWHVHFNDCATGGDIVGADGDYPRLTIDEDGTASASVTVPQSLGPEARYHVNVHLSDEDLATIIACGDLEHDDGPVDAPRDQDAAAPPY